MRQTRLRPTALLLSLLIGLATVTIGCNEQETPSPAPAPEGDVPGDDASENVPADEAANDPSAGGDQFEVEIPLGLPALAIPEDNPMTAEKVELGKMLYFDTRLSKDGTISCATCHDPKMGWAERKPTSEGIGGKFGERNAPTVINAAYAPVQFWDGRAATLEEQAVGPIENEIEMGHDMTLLIEELNAIPEYQERFQAVFGTDVTKDGIAKAIAAFERTVLSGNSPYDRFKAGDDSALTDAQKRGLELFGESCATCHTPELFSNYTYVNTGIGMDAPEPDAGRMDVTENERDLGKFRVPMLRDIADTAPYFHDGSVETLELAVAIMAQGGLEHENRSFMMKAVGSAGLTEDDQKDIVAFLEALSGDYPIVEPPQLP